MISLVITIVVLVIITSISISVVLGEDGIIKKTEDSKQQIQVYEIKSKVRIKCCKNESTTK